MSLPLQRLPGKTYFITRCVAHRQFRLKPTDELNAAIVVLLFAACLSSRVEVIAFYAGSNHVHMVVHDPRGLVSEFMRDFFGPLARFINCMHGVSNATVWDPQQDNAEVLEDMASIIRAVSYTLMNPVKDELVASSSAWPGVITRVDDIGTGRGRVEQRPERFFRKDGPVPAWGHLETHSPPGIDDETFRRLVKRDMDRRKADTLASMRQGRRSFAGVKKVLSVDVFDSPKTLRRPNVGLSAKPRRRIKASTPEVRAAALERLFAFRHAYRVARWRFIHGDRDVVFPPGTYKMFRFFGVDRAPPEAWQADL